MKQAPRAPYDLVCQLIFSYAVAYGLLDALNKLQINSFKEALSSDAAAGLLDLSCYFDFNKEFVKKTKVASSALKLYTYGVIACLTLFYAAKRTEDSTDSNSSEAYVDSFFLNAKKSFNLAPNKVNFPLVLSVKPGAFKTKDALLNLCLVNVDVR